MLIKRSTESAQELVWDGITKSDTLNSDAVQKRHRIADRAKTGDWPGLLSILTGDPRLINTARPDGKAYFAPLHYAAFSGAPQQVIHKLLKLGAFRTLRDAQGQRPVDIARGRAHGHLLSLLDPVFEHHVRPDALSRIQGFFHEVIRGRVNELVVEHSLRLPEIESVLEFASAKFWFAVPDIYGGFSYWLASDEPNAKLMVESWSRISDGSGQRHEISEDGVRLLEEGFHLGRTVR